MKTTTISAGMLRRTFLRGLTGIPLWAADAIASNPLQYMIAARPARGLIGDHIFGLLSCRATRDIDDAITFDDASLVVRFKRLSSEGASPEEWYPNHFAMQQGARTVRFSRSSRQSLLRGHRFAREVDLIPVFAASILDTGTFELSYEIRSGAQTAVAGPTKITIESGPAAVQGLFALLSHDDLGVRERAKGLLHKMTAHVVGYSADADGIQRREAVDRWRAWWNMRGQRMPWNFGSAGATFGDTPPRAPLDQRSGVIGGIAYRLQALDVADAKALVSALTEWLRSGATGHVPGRSLVADETIHYPPEDVMIRDATTVMMLKSALSRLAQAAKSTPSESPAAELILATAARILDVRFVPDLEALLTASSVLAGWHRVAAVTGGLLDVLDPGRTPLGGSH